MDIWRWGCTFQLASFASSDCIVRRRLPLLDTRVPCLARVHERRQVSNGPMEQHSVQVGTRDTLGSLAESSEARESRLQARPSTPRGAQPVNLPSALTMGNDRPRKNIFDQRPLLGGANVPPRAVYTFCVNVVLSPATVWPNPHWVAGGYHITYAVCGLASALRRSSSSCELRAAAAAADISTSVFSTV